MNGIKLWNVNSHIFILNLMVHHIFRFNNKPEHLGILRVIFHVVKLKKLDHFQPITIHTCIAIIKFFLSTKVKLWPFYVFVVSPIMFSIIQTHTFDLGKVGVLKYKITISPNETLIISLYYTLVFIQDLGFICKDNLLYRLTGI